MMSAVGRSLAPLLTAPLVLLLVNLAPPARAASDGVVPGDAHHDPLRQFLPRGDIFMQVPGGVVALSGERDPGVPVEAQERGLHGGIVVGYCLRASCSRVTHLAVLQVCNNRIGGLDDSQALILGVIKLPVGEVPGWLLSLQGRNFAENFSDHGPVRQAVPRGLVSDGAAVHRVLAHGMGPVAPLEYQGLAIESRQSSETIALQLTDGRLGAGPPLTRLEVRHFCERPMS